MDYCLRLAQALPRIVSPVGVSRQVTHHLISFFKAVRVDSHLFRKLQLVWGWTGPSDFLYCEFGYFREIYSDASFNTNVQAQRLCPVLAICTPQVRARLVKP